MCLPLLLQYVCKSQIVLSKKNSGILVTDNLAARPFTFDLIVHEKHNYW
jgi:hypothetical protein